MWTLLHKSWTSWDTSSSEHKPNTLIICSSHRSFLRVYLKRWRTHRQSTQYMYKIMVRSALHSTITRCNNNPITHRSYPVHVLCPCLGCEHREDAGPTPDVQYYLVLEDVLVVIHGVPVGQRPDFVLQHFLIEYKGHQKWVGRGRWFVL